ncbi:hypothetical protein NC653_039454 [Populus alba x Populus x berolinensis]|uniref:Uncharacterized protein n=1 Tax=Populus alba x Populus x berolinensis TaxID=444605 RepID=A0AAD6LB99_9ROSI|nr:hypothetical protein NC653_039454 [Populus alba x Populus x berolinensis]
MSCLKCFLVNPLLAYLLEQIPIQIF